MIPFSPIIEFFSYMRISMFDVIVHQKIVISFFIAGHFFPTITMFGNNLINEISFFTFGKIYACKTSEIPFEIRIFFISSWESKFSVTFYFKRLRNEVLSIVWVYFVHLETFLFITASFVIQYNIYNC